MKIKTFVYASALAAVLVSCQAGGEAPSGQMSAEEAVIENIMMRTSVRAYTDEPVADEQITTLLKAAMAAPTAVNKQPWRFVVVKERATLDSMASGLRGMRMAAHAPLAIAVCGDMDAALEGEAQPFWIQDASAATENLLLAAHALGLGAVWCGVAPLPESMAIISGLLDLPESIKPLCMVVIGHPAESPAPKDKWKPENVHYEKW